jgi:type IV fimbrial biogenesis protein FimT
MSNKGYTFIEFFIVIVFITILLGLAIPAYHKLVLHNRVIAQINQLTTAINLARSEAIKRHSTVTLCKTKDAQTCGGEWRDGWLVFVDKKAEGKVNPGDLILRVYGALPVGDQLNWQATLHKESYLQFIADGSTRGQAGSFVYCPSASDRNLPHPYVITISLTGRVRLTHPDITEAPMICSNTK